MKTQVLLLVLVFGIVIHASYVPMQHKVNVKTLVHFGDMLSLEPSVSSDTNVSKATQKDNSTLEIKASEDMVSWNTYYMKYVLKSILSGKRSVG